MQNRLISKIYDIYNNLIIEVIVVFKVKLEPLRGTIIKLTVIINLRDYF